MKATTASAVQMSPRPKVEPGSNTESPAAIVLL